MIQKKLCHLKPPSHFEDVIDSQENYYEYFCLTNEVVFMIKRRGAQDNMDGERKTIHPKDA